MAKFDETRSALGFFWTIDKPGNKWAGRVYLDGFPRASVHCLNSLPGDGSQPVGRHVFHGITEENEYVTLLEGNCREDGYSYHKGSSTTIRYAISANYMLIGDRHYDSGASVRRLTFSSAMVENVLSLGAKNYRDIRHRPISSRRYEYPILEKQVASCVDLGRRIRIRVLRSTVPSATIKPSSRVTIDFLDSVTPLHALNKLHELKNLLAVICGEVVDLWDVKLLHKVDKQYSESNLYFFDPVERPESDDGFPLYPILDLGKDRRLFRNIIANWLAETPFRKIVRAAFISVVQDKGSLRLSHHRELVTIIETQTSFEGTAPMRKPIARRLRQALIETLTAFAVEDSGSATWLETMKKRICDLNHHDARIIVKKFIDALPGEFVVIPEGFCGEVVDLRNMLTHDLSLNRNDDFNRLAFFVAKLKALIALSDVVALGADAKEINKSSRFLIGAEQTPRNLFGGETNQAGEELTV